MATISTARQPFGELSSARVQALTSKKNSQNAITETLNKAGKEKQALLSTPSKKRAYTPEPFEDDDFDAENTAPFQYSPKRTKVFDGTPRKAVLSMSTSALSPSALKASMVPQATKSSFSPPSSPLAQHSQSSSAPFVLPGGANTAPIGRSPRSKRPGFFGKKSRFSRVDPPTFGTSQSALPFSIDEALAGTFNRPTPKPVKITKCLSFAIWEDTPDQEAQNLMEHCAGILDISSDEEAGPSKKIDRGKENIAPADYVTPNPVAVGQAKGALKARRSIHVDTMADVGEERAPLGALPTEDFYGDGLNARSIAIVREEDENVPNPEPAVPDAEANIRSLLSSIRTPSIDGAAEAGFTIACDDDVDDN